MAGWSIFGRALRPWSPRRHQERECKILDELHFHLEMRARDNVAAGMSVEEAQREARRQFGNVERIKEQCLRVDDTHPARTVVQFIRIVGALALGIGAVCVAFLLVNAAFFRLPLTYHDDHAWVGIWWEHPARGTQSAESSLPEFLTWRSQNRVFEAMTLACYGPVYLTGDGPPKRMFAKRVSADYFALHGVTPLFGRGFRAEEVEFNAQPVAVLSYGLWQQHYDSEAGVVERTITIDGVPHTIVGVMPDDFQMYYPTDVFLPLRFDLEQAGQARQYLVAGRLKDGVTLAQAQADLEALIQPAVAQHPDAYADLRLTLRRIQDVYASPVRHNVLIFLGVVSVLLLVVSMHAFRRQWRRIQERWGEKVLDGAVSQGKAVGAAVGESVLVALVGGLIGLGLASHLVTLVIDPVLGGMAHVFDVRMDGRVAGFGLSLSVLLGLGMGLAPLALAPSHKRLQAARCRTGPARRRGPIKALAVVEVALALVLLLVAGQALRGALDAERTDLGFEPADLFTLPIDLPTTTYPAPGDQVGFFGQMFERVEALPGVEAASLTQAFPTTEGAWNLTVRVEGRPAASDVPTARVSRVGTEYLALMQVPLLRGRLFHAQDGKTSSGVVVVNAALAERLFPGEEPVGRRIVLGDIKKPFKIVGVVGNVRHAGPQRDPPLMAYGLYWQWGGPSMTLVVRARAKPAATAADVRREVRTLDAKLPLGRFMTAEQIIRQPLTGLWRRAGFFSLLALLALGLVMSSVYGLIADAIRSRTREIGIRLAFGACGQDVRLLFLGESARVVLTGTAVGMALAWMGTYVLADLLGGFGSIDLLTYAGVGAVLVGAAVGAGYLSARRAAQIDPGWVLRYV